LGLAGRKAARANRANAPPQQLLRKASRSTTEEEDSE